MSTYWVAGIVLRARGRATVKNKTWSLSLKSTVSWGRVAKQLRDTPPHKLCGRARSGLSGCRGAGRGFRGKS